ncbi:MAG: peptidase S41, partial [Deltaproteobacteria bacterium HGW-Deltaproteobacteria-24]
EKVNHDVKKKEVKTEKSDVITKEDLFKDNQLKTGVDILRSLIILEK